MSTTPLTDAIEALTRYANETTGASDTNLSDAVGTLVAGYGGGGGEDYLAKAISNTLVTYSSDVSGAMRENMFQSDTNLEEISLPNITSLAGNTFYNCQKLKTVNLPAVEVLSSNNQFRQCYALTSIALPSLTTCAAGGAPFFHCTALTAVDLGQLHFNGPGNNFFANAPITTIVLRYTGGVCPLNNTGAFNNTPFMNGGTGGTIYVPQALLATYPTSGNWATANGWGTITWKAIEGSYYETHYADGTVIQ